MAEGFSDKGGMGLGEDAPLSDAHLKQILEALKSNGDYVVLTKSEYAALHKPVSTSTPAPKRPLTDFIRASQAHDFSLHPSQIQVPKFETPKLPYFSGDQPPLKGDESYAVCRFETKCLISENLPEQVILQVIRRSSRGTARRTIISLGEHASSVVILDKLDILFGEVSTNESVMQSFYNASSENVTAYGCRLEALLQVAVESGHVTVAARNDMLRSKFWTGLRDEKLKILTRNKYDSISDYNTLLREVRSVEHELSASSNISASVNAAQQSTPVDKKTIDDLTGKIDLLMNKMLSLENRYRRSQKETASSSNNYFSRNRYNYQRRDGNYQSYNQQRPR
ncbi:uncharacterized protein LOC132757299 [Ruditapes philippinarum]|uniref:uncharacterized protein LOC132757299 n=1 Tax=Ruditapes philippinarum TaxID=129788 RepID=UPI00295AEE4D|nr:uncharacterized protein LOC132757299 [Ruditapes philippinarum]